MRDDLPKRLRRELDGTTEHSPVVRRLLYEAAVEIERLRALLAARIQRGGKRDDDDDGAPRVVLAGPPNKPRGPLPASAVFATVDGDDVRQEVGSAHDA